MSVGMVRLVIGNSKWLENQQSSDGVGGDIIYWCGIGCVLNRLHGATTLYSDM